MNSLPFRLPPQLGKILLVEDETLVRMGVGEFLREAGYLVHEATSAGDAIDRLNGGLMVDLVITDVRMPGGIDGFDLVRWIKCSMPAIRVMVISGVVRPSERPTDVDEWVVFLTKPSTRGVMLGQIARVISEPVVGAA